MVDPRIYRASWILVALALILFGFSLETEPAARTSESIIGSYFSDTGSLMSTLAGQFPDRKAGSDGDARLAAAIASRETAIGGFQVSTQSNLVRTASGRRALQTVVATRPGIQASSIVVISARDSSVSGNPGGLSGTAVMIELARALSGQSLKRGLTLISTSGQIGAVGATGLARKLVGGPVSAVIVLGNLAGRKVRQPVIVPFSDSNLVAPLELTSTLAGFVGKETDITNREPAFGGQLLRLAFPLSVTGQAPFVSRRVPAVLLSLSGDRPTSGELGAVNPNITDELGVAVAETVEALDTGASVGVPSATVTLSAHSVPLWAVRILVLALLAPVILATIDAAARARRHGHSLRRWLVWVLGGTLPFIVGYAAVLFARVTGILGVVTPGAVGAGEVPLTGRGIATMAGSAVLVLIAFLLLRPSFMREAAGEDAERDPDSPAANAAATAVSIVATVTALVIWLVNPFAAFLVVPAVHVWLWLAEPEVRRRRWLTIPGMLLTVAPIVVVVLYYRSLYGFTFLQLLWTGALMIAGRSVAIVPGLCWCVFGGCLFSSLLVMFRGRGDTDSTDEPEITVRGPIGYAGPGSLGGTESALRR